MTPVSSTQGELQGQRRPRPGHPLHPVRMAGQAVTPPRQDRASTGEVMRSAAAQVDIAATPATLWAPLPPPAQPRLWLSGLTITSAWQPGARVDAYYGSANIATGAVVIAAEPSR